MACPPHPSGTIRPSWTSGNSPSNAVARQSISKAAPSVVLWPAQTPWQEAGYPTISLFLKQKAISFFAVSGESEPCAEFLW
jgi:hypothetical protein